MIEKNNKPTVYLETTIPSFYFSEREEPEMVAIRDWTREWWQRERGKYELVSSVAVLDELRQVAIPESLFHSDQ